MNCARVREQLPLLLYEEVEPAEAKRLREHLAACPTCRQEQAAWQHLHRTLDADLTPPMPVVSVPALYRRLAKRQENRTRTWKWAACLAATAAAALAFLMVLRGVELRVDGQQLVVRWGTPPQPSIEDVSIPPIELASLVPVEPIRPATSLEERIAVLGQIMRALAANAEGQADGRSQELALLRARLGELQWLQRRDDARLADLERDFRTLYKVHFVLKEKGEIP